MKRLLSVLGVLVIGSASLWAQANANGPDTPPTATQSPTALTKHLLKGTYVSTGSAGALGGGFTNIDAVSNVVCPGTSGNCLIQADQVFQVGGTSSASRVAILLRVDGALVGDSPYNGDTLANGHYTSLVSSHGFTVPHGTHTVQTAVFTEFPVQGGSYVFQYKVYKP